MASRNPSTHAAPAPFPRRDALKAALALPAAACVTRTDDDGTGDGSTPKVIVIGAGMAGLSAARRLKQEGYDVVVFERQDRKGGRVLTTRPTSGPAAGKPIELGPVFLHGIDTNPLVAVARELGLTVTPVDNTSRHAFYDLAYVGNNQVWIRVDTSTELKRSDPPLTYRDAWARALTDFDAVLAATNDGKADAVSDTTLRDAFYDARDRLGMRVPKPIDDVSGDFYATIAYDRFDRSRFAGMNQLSWLHWNEGEPLGGTDGVVAEGLDVLVERLADGIEIVYGTKGEVESIDWTERGATVVTADGKEHVAQAVVFAVPRFGYSSGVQITPDLPDEKSSAFGRFDGLNVNHFYLHFADLSWFSGVDSWLVNVNEVDINNPAHALVRTMQPILGTPTLLVVNLGSKASEMDGMSEFDLANEIMVELRKIFVGAPDPLDKAGSKWTKGDFPTFSVSAISSRDSVENRAAIAKADTGRLYWASDLTSTKYPNTLHGAYESGIRAAEQAIAALSKA